MTVVRRTWVLLFASLLILLGCVSTSSEHAVYVQNIGSTVIYDLSVQYGVAQVAEARPLQPQIGFQQGFNGPVPDELRVSWRTDPGESLRSAVVQVRQHRSIYLWRWVVQMDGRNIKVFREDIVGPVNPNTMLAPRRRVPIFP